MVTIRGGSGVNRPKRFIERDTDIFAAANKMRHALAEKSAKNVGPEIDNLIRNGFTWDEIADYYKGWRTKLTLQKYYGRYQMSQGVSGTKRIINGEGHEILVMRQQGLTWKQVGEKLNIQPATAKKRFQRWSMADEQAYNDYHSGKTVVKDKRFVLRAPIDKPDMTDWEFRDYRRWIIDNLGDKGWQRFKDNDTGDSPEHFIVEWFAQYER